MKFGFDIDDTLINLRGHAFSIYNRKLNQSVPIEAFQALKRVEIHEPFGLTDEEGKEMWNGTLEEIYYTSCPIYPGAKELLQKLVDEGHELYYITARPKEHGERTKAWLKEQGFPVHDDKFFYGMKDQDKVKIIKELDLDYYFDDKPDVLNTLLNERVKIFIKDQSYNRHLDLPRVINWSEFESLIK